MRHRRTSKEQYLSYLLRLWQVRIGNELVWRASLERPHTGERLGFANLEKLFTYLRQQTGRVSDSDRDEDEAEQQSKGR